MARSNTRAPSGGGTVRHRDDGRWEGRYNYYDEYGNQRRGSVYAQTQKECRQKLASVVAEVDSTGTHRVQSTLTYRQWFDHWIETYSVNWKPNTKKNYRQKAELYILPKIGERSLSELTPIICQRLVNSFTKEHGLNPKTVKNLHTILHSSLKKAVAMKEIPSNPAHGLELPKSASPDLHPLMDADIGKFLKAAEVSEFYDLFVVALFTGMRISELIGLKWDDVSFPERLIRVTHQLQRSEETGEYLTLTPKNGKGRIVPLSPSMISVLKGIRSKQAENQLAAGELWEGDGYVFTNDIGHHYKHATVQHHFKKIARAAGYENLRFHDLRHSCAILALQTGADIKSVSEMLGHYSTAFTMDVYGAVSDEMNEKTRNSMELAFKATLG